jgi:hypothetical protein
MSSHLSVLLFLPLVKYSVASYKPIRRDPGRSQLRLIFIRHTETWNQLSIYGRPEIPTNSSEERSDPSVMSNIQLSHSTYIHRVTSSRGTTAKYVLAGI